MHTGRKGRYTARISLLMKRSDLGRVRFEAVLRSVHRFVRLVYLEVRVAASHKDSTLDLPDIDLGRAPFQDRKDTA